MSKYLSVILKYLDQTAIKKKNHLLIGALIHQQKRQNLALRS